MKSNNPSDNVIRLSDRMKVHKTGCALTGKPQTGRKTHTRVIAVTSGKGGVGKTNIVANLGYTFARMGKKVLILDADLGLGNLDVLLGLAPKYNLSHVIMGEKSVGDIIVEGPGNMLILQQQHHGIHFVMALEFLEYQLDVPSGTIKKSNVLGNDLFRRMGKIRVHLDDGIRSELE